MRITREISRHLQRNKQAGSSSVAAVAGRFDKLGRGVKHKVVNRQEKAPKLTIVRDLPERLKKHYLRVLVWLTYHDDGKICEQELCEIYLLMTQLECASEVRADIRSCLEDPRSLDVKTEIRRMLELVRELKPDTKPALPCTLMKDAIRLRRATAEGPVRQEVGIRKLAGFLDLKEEQVKVIEDFCQKDEHILQGNLNIAKYKKTLQSLTQQAAGVGVPITGLYLSGSVTGLSAAGITSGLAGLGFGGLLGLSSMVTGIGVVIVTGGIVYKGIGWLLSSYKRGLVSYRELMLQEVLSIHQKAISSLGKDVAHVGERIGTLSAELGRNRTAIDRLNQELTLLFKSAAALGRLGDKANGFESDLRGQDADRKG